jgi:2-methoxy-6-polyprenyl-1,4-benzoquinol methylase
MLRVGQRRALERGYGDELKWLVANAEDLKEVESDSLDLYTIVFGIRNVTNREKALAEAHRVLKRGGRFMCLEFSHVQVPGLREVYDTYSLNVIPFLGDIIAKDKESYQYLVESIRMFPTQEKFLKMIEATGFKYCTYTNMTGGMVAIHSGFKF